MTLSWPIHARAPKRKRPGGVIPLAGFPHGLRTDVPAFQIQKTELAKCINYKFLKGGKLESRAPIIKYSNSATTSNATVKLFERVPIGGTNRDLLVDSNFKLYYLDGSLDPTSIGTLEGDAVILAYNGVAVILDGSYIKYLDGVGAANLKIAYDDGTGTSGYQFDNISGDEDSTVKLGDGTNTRIAYKFTSQSWTTGYTIPPTTFTVKLSEAGTASATAITARLRLVSDNSILAAKELLADATDLTGVATEYSITFTSSDITTEMSRNVAYYMSIEHTGGDGVNHVLVHCSDVASAGVCYKWTGAAWVNVTTQNPIMSLRPGMPPKASFGCNHNNRLFVAGDSDNPGYSWYCNLTHLDWSTDDGGGYVGAVDENNNNYEIGALQSLYNDLFVYGTEDQPYLCKLSGATPTNYSLPHLFQRVWSTHKTLRSVGNDLWGASEIGVDTLSGVQEYGDLRTFSVSDPVADRITDHWASSTAIAEYNPFDGHYLLCMPSYHGVLIGHTKTPTVDPTGMGSRYPWSEYEFYKNILSSSTYKWTASGSGTSEYYVELAAGGDPSISTQPDFITLDSENITEGTAGSLDDHGWDYGDNDTLGYNTVYIRDDTGDPDVTSVEIRSILSPTCFGSFAGEFFIGSSDGFIYKFDSTDYKDLSEYQIEPIFATAYIETPFVTIDLEKYQVVASARMGAELNVTLFKDGFESQEVHTWTHNLAAQDDLTLNDVQSVDLIDAKFPLSRQAVLLWKDINVNCRSFQVEVKATTLIGEPLYFDGLIMKYRGLQG